MCTSEGAAVSLELMCFYNTIRSHLGTQICMPLQKVQRQRDGGELSVLFQCKMNNIDILC